MLSQTQQANVYAIDMPQFNFPDEAFEIIIANLSMSSLNKLAITNHYYYQLLYDRRIMLNKISANFAKFNFQFETIKQMIQGHRNFLLYARNETGQQFSHALVCVPNESNRRQYELSLNHLVRSLTISSYEKFFYAVQEKQVHLRADELANNQIQYKQQLHIDMALYIKQLLQENGLKIPDYFFSVNALGEPKTLLDLAAKYGPEISPRLKGLILALFYVHRNNPQLIPLYFLSLFTSVKPDLPFLCYTYQAIITSKEAYNELALVAFCQELEKSLLNLFDSFFQMNGLSHLASNNQTLANYLYTNNNYLLNLTQTMLAIRRDFNHKFVLIFQQILSESKNINEFLYFIQPNTNIFALLNGKLFHDRLPKNLSNRDYSNISKWIIQLLEVDPTISLTHFNKLELKRLKKGLEHIPDILLPANKALAFKFCASVKGKFAKKVTFLKQLGKLPNYISIINLLKTMDNLIMLFEFVPGSSITYLQFIVMYPTYLKQFLVPGMKLSIPQIKERILLASNMQKTYQQQLFSNLNNINGFPNQDNNPVNEQLPIDQLPVNEDLQSTQAISVIPMPKQDAQMIPPLLSPRSHTIRLSNNELTLFSRVQVIRDVNTSSQTASNVTNDSSTQEKELGADNQPENEHSEPKVDQAPLSKRQRFN